MTLAGSAVALLVSYLGHLGDHVIHKAGDDLDDAVTRRLDRPYEASSPVFPVIGSRPEPCSNWRRRPQDALYQGGLQLALAQLIEQDKEFASLVKSVEDGGAAAPAQRNPVTGSGPSNVGGNVAITSREGLVAGRDVNGGTHELSHLRGSAVRLHRSPRG